MLIGGGGGDGGHFTLTVDPEAMIAQGPALASLSLDMTELYGTMTKASSGLDDIFRGQGADSFELSFPPALQFLPAFATALSHASESLGTLGETYSTAVTTTLPSLNQQWDTAVAAHDSAVTASAKTFATDSAAANTPHDATAAASQQRTRDTNAADALTTTQGTLNRQFATLHESLVSATKKAAGELSELVEGESLYEAIDQLNSKIGIGLNPAAFALVLPEAKALKNLLATTNALTRVNAEGVEQTVAASEKLAASLARGDIGPDAAAKAMLQTVTEAAQRIKSAVTLANKAGKSAGIEGGLDLLAREGSPAAKALEMFARGVAVVAVFSDVLTMINPGDEGTAHGWVTRTMALGNLVGTKMAFTKAAETAAEGTTETAAEGGGETLLEGGGEAIAEEASGEVATATVVEAGGETAALVTTELAGGEVVVAMVPVVGQVLVVGTGLYLMGDYMYQNVKWFHDGVNDVASAVYDAGKEQVEAVVNAGKDVYTAGKDTVHAVEDVNNAVNSAVDTSVHAVSSTISSAASSVTHKVSSVASDCNPFNW